MVAIDLGSNTIRMIEYDCDKKEVLNSFEKIVKTADKLVDSGVISDETIDRIVKAIEEAKEKLNFTDVVAVTTEALRQAKNKDEVLKIVKEKTGVEFKIISADEEAYYTTIATEEVIAKRYRYKNMFLVDIGGGSTELILKNKKELISESFQIGIVTIS